MKILLLGMSHRSAPVEVRELYAVEEAEAREAQRKLVGHAEIGEVVLILLCAWAVHFRAGLALGRAHLAEVGIFALVVLVGLFYLFRKEGRE